MSTTKIIKGQIKQWEEPIGVMNAKFTAAHSDVRESLNWEPATLYIGTGKLWTEDEVRAYGDDLLSAHMSPGQIVERADDYEEPLYRWIDRAIKAVNAKHGLPF